MYVQQTANNSYLPSVLRAFALSLGIAFIGTMAGVFVPPALFLPLMILELGIAAFRFPASPQKGHRVSIPVCIYIYFRDDGLSDCCPLPGCHWPEPRTGRTCSDNGCVYRPGCIRYDNQAGFIFSWRHADGSIACPYCNLYFQHLLAVKL